MIKRTLSCNKLCLNEPLDHENGKSESFELEENSKNCKKMHKIDKITGKSEGKIRGLKDLRIN